MNALDDFVTKSAISYLQSVVFVDDKIYETKGGKPLESSSLANSLGRGLESQFGGDSAGDEAERQIIGEPAKDEKSAAPDNPPADAHATPQMVDATDQTQYHPRELMESFAQKGIVCALYEPQKGFTTDPESVLFRLCERADVIILDWDFYNDDGDAVSELLTELIKESANELPHHVRLCALYTNKPSLHPVMDALLAKLKSRECIVDVVQGKLHLIAGATRISIFGKPVTVGRPPDDKPYEVQESDLADRIIAELASLHHGLMPAFALHGLAAVRRNTKRLLDKFRSELDGPFLLHRGLVLSDGDAFDELPELLSDEIRAVLEDAWPVDTPLDEVISAALNVLPLKEPTPSWKTLTGQPYNAVPILREIITKGEEGLVVARQECNEAKDFTKGPGFRGAKPARLKDFDEMLAVKDNNWSEHLAALFCNRTQYGTDGRTLRFGTIVRHKLKETDQWVYSICLMPICDSQRLTKKFAFPFWRLKENVKDGLDCRRYGVAVIDSQGKTHCLAAGGKIRDMLWIAEFEPNGGCVVAEKNNQGFLFVVAGMIVEWIAELKPLHAQRIAAYLGSEVSRVGLVESEWLRLFCDR